MKTNLKKLPFDQEYHQDQVIHEDQEDPEINSNWINTKVFEIEAVKQMMLDLCPVSHLAV